MSDLEAGFSVEQGGHHARTGFQYQDYVAAWWLIQMLGEESLVRIGCELGDDIPAIRSTPEGEHYLYIQVKFRESPKPWSLSDIASPESGGGRSLVQKSIARGTSTTPHEVTSCSASVDWLLKTKWLPLGGFEAVSNAALWSLHKWLASRRLFLGPDAVEEIHARILKLAQNLATGTWSEAVGEHTLSRDALVAVLTVRAHLRPAIDSRCGTRT
jgi:hypothetical protein